MALAHCSWGLSLLPAPFLDLYWAPNSLSVPCGFPSPVSSQPKGTMGPFPLAPQSHMCPLGLKLCMGHGTKGQHPPKLLATYVG